MISRATKHAISRHARTPMRTSRRRGAALSKPNRRCRSRLADHFSRCKSRPTNARATTKAVRYYHRSQQYSVTALTDSNGNVTERYAYSAYGTPTITDASGAVLSVSADNNRYTYTGREWDEVLSLQHFRARMYDSRSGRFLGRDPIGFRAGDVNRFRWLSGQPLQNVDPSGLWTIEWDGFSETTVGGLPWLGPTIFPSGSWTGAEQNQIGLALERIEKRISELLIEIETFKTTLTECELGYLDFEIESLANMLECIQDGIQSDDVLELWHQDNGDPNVGGISHDGSPFGTGLLPGVIYDPWINLNSGAEPNLNWQESEINLDRVLAHELSHLCGTTDLIDAIEPAANSAHTYGSSIYGTIIHNENAIQTALAAEIGFAKEHCARGTCPPADEIAQGPVK